MIELHQVTSFKVKTMFNRQSLRYRVNIAIAAIFLTSALIFGAVLFFHEMNRRKAVILDIKQSLDDLSDQYGEQLGNEIFASQSLAVQATLNDIMARHSILAITTYTESGQILVSSDPLDQENLSKARISLLESGPVTKKQNWENHEVLSFICKLSAYGETAGFWQIHYSLETLERQTREIVFIFSGLLVSLTVLICVILDRLLIRLVLNPVQLLGNAMQQIQGEGRDPMTDTEDLGKMIESFDRLAHGLNVPKTDRNEISALANSFRQMLLFLKTAYIRMRTDPLTGLGNRMRLDEAMKESLDRARRYHSPFSIILLDIDHFKKINDTCGHLVGDTVLKMLSDLLKSALRKSDLAGRWGGEEFLILLPFQNLDHAVQVARKLKSLIEQTQFPQVGKVTASCGVAQYQFEKTVSDFVDKADQALYQAKASGRNRVVGFTGQMPS